MPGPRSLRLLEVAGPPLGPPPPASPAGGRLGAELGELLAVRNGFYAMESALHVFASGSAPEDHTTLEEWNAPTGWRASYGGLAEGFLFFAEDAFGGQFAIRDDAVHTFDPETGEAQPLAASIEEWADRLLTDYAFLTGFPLAHDWQQRNGPLPPGRRLVPKIPFVLGGEYDVENLYAGDAAEGMRARGEVAVQIRDLPDGAAVRYRVVE